MRQQWPPMMRRHHIIKKGKREIKKYKKKEGRKKSKKEPIKSGNNGDGGHLAVESRIEFDLLAAKCNWRLGLALLRRHLAFKLSTTIRAEEFKQTARKKVNCSPPTFSFEDRLNKTKSRTIIDR